MRDANKKTLEDTLEILENGYYRKDGREVNLRLSRQEMEHVQVLLPEDAESICSQMDAKADSDKTDSVRVDARSDSAKTDSDRADTGHGCADTDKTFTGRKCSYSCENIDSFALARKRCEERALQPKSGKAKEMEMFERVDFAAGERTGTMLTAVKGDITKNHGVQAIVNAANTSLLGGGGVDGAIHRAAGSGLLKECRTLNGCETGKAKITKGYCLPCEYVIHTPGPCWGGGKFKEEELLASCYQSCLELAADNGIRSVAFPSISTGIYRFPLELAAEIAVRTVKKFVKEYPGELDAVKWVLFDERTLEVYKRELERQKGR